MGDLYLLEAIDRHLKQRYYPNVQAKFDANGKLVIDWTKRAREGMLRQCFIALCRELKADGDQERLNNQKFLCQKVEDYYIMENLPLPKGMDTLRREIQDVQNVTYASEFGVSDEERERRKKAEKYYRNKYKKEKRLQKKKKIIESVDKIKKW